MNGLTTRGKIPVADRPGIVARYESGESIASISRSFGCTAPAIRYLIKRTKGTLSRDNEARRRGTHGSAPKTSSPGLSALDILRPASFPQAGNNVRASAKAIGKSGSGNLDHALRDRITGDIAAFLVAFDAATRELSRQNIEILVDATDSLLQACARTRMELDRLRTLPSKVRPLPDRKAKTSEPARARRRRR